MTSPPTLSICSPQECADSLLSIEKRTPKSTHTIRLLPRGHQYPSAAECSHRDHLTSDVVHLWSCRRSPIVRLMVCVHCPPRKERWIFSFPSYIDARGEKNSPPPLLDPALHVSKHFLERARGAVWMTGDNWRGDPTLICHKGTDTKRYIKLILYLVMWNSEAYNDITSGHNFSILLRLFL